MIGHRRTNVALLFYALGTPSVIQRHLKDNYKKKVIFLPFCVHTADTASIL